MLKVFNDLGLDKMDSPKDPSAGFDESKAGAKIDWSDPSFKGRVDNPEKSTTIPGESKTK